MGTNTDCCHCLNDCLIFAINTQYLAYIYCSKPNTQLDFGAFAIAKCDCVRNENGNLTVYPGILIHHLGTTSHVLVKFWKTLYNQCNMWSVLSRHAKEKLAT
jgi:hypothetical protein